MTDILEEYRRIEYFEWLYGLDENIPIYPSNYCPVLCPVCNSTKIVVKKDDILDSNRRIYRLTCLDCHDKEKPCEFVIIIENFKLIPRNLFDFNLFSKENNIEGYYEE